ncbi:hypothetical protein ES702_04367 [subsurface metagenome]
MWRVFVVWLFDVLVSLCCMSCRCCRVMDFELSAYQDGGSDGLDSPRVSVRGIVVRRMKLLLQRRLRKKELMLS